MLHNAQRTTTLEIQKYKQENSQLREELTKMKNKILRIYELLRETELDPSYHLIEVGEAQIA